MRMILVYYRAIRTQGEHVEMEPNNSEYLLASSEALLAGTLALMTGQAQASSPVARCQMTQKICSNLLELGQHPALHPNFRAAMRHLHAHWCQLDAVRSADVGQPRQVSDQWLPPSRTLQ